MALFGHSVGTITGGSSVSDRTAALATERENHNRTHSPFLRLPGEILNQIYGYVLYDGTYLFYHYSPGLYFPAPLIIGSQGPNLRNLSILSVCKKTHHDTALLPFALNTFRCDALHVFEGMLSTMTMTQRQAITSLHLMFRFYDVFRGLATTLIDSLSSKDIAFNDMFPRVKHLVIEYQPTPHKHVFTNMDWIRAVMMEQLLPMEQWLCSGAEGKRRVEFQGGWFHYTRNGTSAASLENVNLNFHRLEI